MLYMKPSFLKPFSKSSLQEIQYLSKTQDVASLATKLYEIALAVNEVIAYAETVEARLEALDCKA